MDFPNAQTLYSSLASRRLIAVAAVLALAIYAAILARNVGAVAGGSDGSGYMNHARALASGRLHVQPRIIEGLPQSSAPPFLYVPLGFKPALKGDGMVPTYPTGFPIFVLLLSPLTGWRHAGDAVIILHSLAGLVATYALGRVLGLGRRWSAVGAAIVAASPLYLFMSILAMSDVPSLLWTTLAVLAALKSRSNMRWALGAGCAIAIDVLLRPTNALAFVPVGIALGASFRRWIVFVLGGLPGVIFFCAHNFAAYGRYVTTGYGDGIVFMASFIPETLLHYARWIPAFFTPIAVFCLCLPWLASEATRIRWILGAWIFAFASFYSAYQGTRETWWGLRFLLPAIPAIVVGGLLVCRALLTKIPGHSGPGRALAVFVAALALVAGNSFLWGRELHALSIGRGELKYGLICEWMTKNLQPNAVIAAMAATGAIHYYTNFTFIRFDAMDSANVARVEAAVRNTQRPLYAILFPFEIGDMHAIDKRMPGHWIQVGNVDDVTIWRRNFDTANLILERPAGG